VLNELAALGTNLTKIESRPVHGKPWEYIFYVDCQIQSSDEGSRALDALTRHCAMVKELGRYKEASQKRSRHTQPVTRDQAKTRPRQKQNGDRPKPVPAFRAPLIPDP
jgi:hypothetical protein